MSSKKQNNLEIISSVSEIAWQQNNDKKIIKTKHVVLKFIWQNNYYSWSQLFNVIEWWIFKKNHGQILDKIRILAREMGCYIFFQHIILKYAKQ